MIVFVFIFIFISPLVFLSRRTLRPGLPRTRRAVGRADGDRDEKGDRDEHEDEQGEADEDGKEGWYGAGAFPDEVALLGRMWYTKAGKVALTVFFHNGV